MESSSSGGKQNKFTEELFSYVLLEVPVCHAPFARHVKHMIQLNKNHSWKSWIVTLNNLPASCWASEQVNFAKNF